MIYFSNIFSDRNLEWIEKNEYKDIAIISDAINTTISEIDKLVNQSFYDSKIYIIIHNNTKQYIEDYLTEIWNRFKFMNIIVFNVDSDSQNKFTSFKIYFYDAFIIQDERRGFVYEIDAENFKSPLETAPELLTQRLLNLHKYPLQICITPGEGTVAPEFNDNGTIIRYRQKDGELIHLVAETMNATPIYFAPPDGQAYGVELDNGSLTGCLLFSETNRADIVAKAWPLSSSENKYTKSLIVVGDKKLGCISPKQSDTVKIFYTSIFGGWVFVIIFWSHTSTVWILILTDRFYSKKFNWEKFFNYYFTTVGYMVMVSQNAQILNTYKTIFIFWIFFSMITCIMYQSKMVESLTTSKSSKDINTIEELADSGYKLFIRQGFGRMIDHIVDSEEYPEIYETLKSRMVEISENDALISRVYEKKDGVAFCSMAECELLKMTIYSNETGRDLLHVFGEHFGGMQHAQVSHIRSAFRQRFLDIILAICESGFILKWGDLDYHRLKISSMRRRHEFIKDIRSNVFSMRELRFIFQFLVLAWVICFIVFLLELFWNYVQ